MKYEMKVEGLAEISELLSELEEQAEPVAARALYDGAGIVADAITKRAEQIKTSTKSVRNGRRLPTPAEKEIVLKASAGIARFDKNGTEINTSIGYRNAGYADLNGKTVPIPVIVNSINSGTSFMKAQPFIRAAATKAEPKALQAMKAKVESELEAITNK